MRYTTSICCQAHGGGAQIILVGKSGKISPRDVSAAGRIFLGGTEG